MESFQQAQNWLKTLEPKWGVLSGKKKMSLDVASELLEKLGNPDESFKYRVIIGGTAGKGTVVRKLGQTLHEAGIRVGCLTSPHLQTILERVQISGKLADPETFGQSILKVKTVVKDTIPTQYEAIMLASVLYCREAGCEVFIAEVGLGGEFDAVNALKGPRIAGVTFIGDDHRDILGDLPDIAKTKAKIFNEDSLLNVSYEREFESILKNQACGPVEFIKGVQSNLNNKMVKRIAREILGDQPFEVAHIKLPARWEKIPDTNLILDGSHSAPRFKFLIPKIKKLSGPKYAIISMAQNHDSESLRLIYQLFDKVVFTQSQSNETKFHAPEDLERKFPGSLVAKDFDEALKALDNEPEGKILITGSFYFCGEVRERFYPSAEIITQRSEFV